MIATQRERVAKHIEEMEECRKEEWRAMLAKMQRNEEERERRYRAMLREHEEAAQQHDVALEKLRSDLEEEEQRHSQVKKLLEQEMVREEERYKAQLASQSTEREEMERSIAIAKAQERTELLRLHREQEKEKNYAKSEEEVLRAMEAEMGYYVKRAEQLSHDVMRAEAAHERAKEKARKLEAVNARTDELEEQRKTANSVLHPKVTKAPAKDDVHVAKRAPDAAKVVAPLEHRLRNLGLLAKLDEQVRVVASGGTETIDSFGRDRDDPEYVDVLQENSAGTVWTEEALQAAFARFDRDSSNYLDRDEFEAFFREEAMRQGVEGYLIPSQEQIDGILAKSGRDRSGLPKNAIDFDDFCILMLWLAKK